jgi:ComF family protein
MIETIRQSFAGVLDVLYPARCLICQAWDQPGVCAECIVGFVNIPEPVCEVCGHPDDPEGAACRVCVAAESAWGGWALTRSRAACVYLGPMRHALHRLKYEGVEALGELLGPLLANRMVTDGLLLESYDAVIPVPLTESRQTRRGFNQAALLALPLAEALNAPLLERAVLRQTAGEAQVRLSPDARRRAVRAEHFVAAEPAQVAGKRVLLVDDVFTTGATVNALALCLLSHGAIQVDACALAAGG